MSSLNHLDHHREIDDTPGVWIILTQNYNHLNVFLFVVLFFPLSGEGEKHGPASPF